MLLALHFGALVFGQGHIERYSTVDIIIPSPIGLRRDR